MKMRFSAPLLLALLAGCSDDEPTSPALEALVLSVLGGLEVGEAVTLSGEDARTLYLNGGADGAEYVYVPFFASETGAAQLAVEVSGADVRGASGPPNPARIPSGLSGSLSAFGTRPATDQDFHLDLRQREARFANRRLRSPGWNEARSRMLRNVSAQAQAVPQVGSVIELNVAVNDPCENPEIRTARVVAVSDHAIVVADTENPEGEFSDPEYQEIAREFDRLVYPVDTNHFGTPADIDNNDRVLLFFTSAVNELTPPGSQGLVAGFFFGRDLFPREDPNPNFACPASNQAELFYLLVPDPTGSVSSQPLTREDVFISTIGVVAHEFQHLINLSRRIFVNEASVAEEVWLNEGLSHIAEELMFFAETPFEPGENIELDDLSEATFDALIRYQINNLARYNLYVRNPDEESLLGIEVFDDQLTTRGATWAFLRYAADQEPGPDNEFFFDLVNSDTSGVANLNQVLDDVPALDLMQAWTVSVYTDDAGIPVRPIFTQPSWDYRDILPIFLVNEDRFPLPVRGIDEGASERLTLQGGGAAFIRFGVAPGGRATISTTSGGATPPDNLRFSVVRTR